MSSRIKFRITSGIEIGDANKLLFAFAGNCREDSMIGFLYPFDLLKGPFIILLSCDGFQYGGIVSFFEVKVKINLKSMRIAVISKNSQSSVIQPIKMLCLKFHQIYLNKLLETIVLDIFRSVLIDLIYNILVK